jgi:hydroxymethylbilane synthase
MISNRTIRLGPRGSVLARAQSGLISTQVRTLTRHEVTENIIKTEGDDVTAILSKLARPGIFVTALRTALLAGEVDFLVHSYKDLPSLPATGITLAAVPAREDARDVLISRSGLGLMQLPSGSLMGTSSPRRAARIHHLRPDLNILPIRGNIDTRLRKISDGDFDAGVLAAAGLKRVQRSDEITEYFTMEQLLPAPAQGALAIECRSEDMELRELLAQLDHPNTRLTTTAERAILIGIGATCSTAIGAFAHVDDGRLTIMAELSDGAEDEHERFSSYQKDLGQEDFEKAHLLGLSVAELIRATPLGMRLSSLHE